MGTVGFQRNRTWKARTLRCAQLRMRRAEGGACPGSSPHGTLGLHLAIVLAGSATSEDMRAKTLAYVRCGDAPVCFEFV
jgi:hypothetical protein